MNIKILIGIYVFVLAACNNHTQNNPIGKIPNFISDESILIVPTIGIDSINFYTNYNMKSFRYKQMSFTMDSGQSVADASNGAYYQNWIRLTNKPNGLSFTFSTASNPDPNLVKQLPKILTEINIWDNKSAHFLNGIAIGSSTFQDVVDAFGQLPTNWKNTGFIDYRNKGVSFSFNNNRILQAVTLKKIAE